ncbi:MAG: (d)CMP kinase [Nanoarchaeales archaeon]|nr:(d)CMP kinase [Nanoarchaeales archaeon]
MNNLSIAIDGPSGVGKGITTKLVSKELNLKALDSGAIYRAIAYYMLSNKIKLKTFKDDILKNINISFTEHNFVELNGVSVDDKIRNDEIGRLASDFGKIKSIRKFATEIQKKLVLSSGYVVEGRATAYEIPQIPIKIFLTADMKVRAQRRYEEYKQEDPSIKFKEVLENIKERDMQDKSRLEHPLIKHKDAHLIDNSNLSIDEQVKLIVDIYDDYVTNLNNKHNK